MAGTLHSFFRKVPKEQQQLKTPAPAKTGVIDLTEQNSRTTDSAKKSDRCTLQQASGHDSDAPTAFQHTSAANLSPSEPLLKKSLDAELHSTAKRPRLICAADAQRLCDAFTNDPNPSAQQRLTLASETGLSDEQIASWFANKRKTSERTDSTSKTAMQPLNDTTNTHTSQPSTSSARSQPGTSQSQPTNSHTAPDNSRTEAEEPESSAPASGQPSSSEQPPAKRQKTASPDLVLSAEERKVLGAQYSAEADDLRAALSSCWLRDHAPDILRPPPAAAASAADSKQVVLNKAEVALLVEGRHEPLSQLCTIVALQLAAGPEAPDGPPAPSPLPPPTINQQAVREMIIDVATRSSSITPAAAEADPQEAAGGAGQWRWEVRDLKLLPKPARDFVELARKRRKQLKDRLSKVEEVGRLLLAPASTKAHAGKISRAMAKAEKAGGLEVVEGACQESLSALFTKHSMQREAVVQKEAAKKEKEEHKRAAEEARRKAEEARRQEAERHKQEKAAEKEKQRAEREAKKVEDEAKHAGFGSKGALNKSRSLLQNFFKPAAKPAAATATAAPAAPAAPPSTPALNASQDPSQKPLFDIPPIPRSDASKAFQVELDAVVAAGQLPGAAVVVALEGFKASWRAQRPLATRLPGAPPTWARKPGPPEAFPLMVEKYYGEGADQRAVRTWRRKLLHHHTSLRPAYYGSFSRTSTEVRGRRPLGQDPSLDYEVMSDEDWEEEPEGESLSEDDGGEEEAKAGEEDEEMDDGFVVDDGYLSEDEGFQGGGPGEEDVMDVDDPAGAAGGPGGASGPAAVQPTDPRLQHLEVAMERARRANRPLLLTTLPTIQAPAPPTSLDSALLCLRAIVLAPPPAAVTAPGDADADAVQFGQAAADRAAAGRPRPAVALAPGVVEQLVAFLQATTEKGIEKVVAAFQAAHPSPPPPSKNRLRNAIRAMAVYKGGRWVLESTSPSKHGAENEPPPAPSAGIFQRLATPATAPAARAPTTLPPTTTAASQHPPAQPHLTPEPAARPPTSASRPTPTSLPTSASARTPTPTPTPTPIPAASTPQPQPSSKTAAQSKPAGIKSYFSTAKQSAAGPKATATPSQPPPPQNHATRPSTAAPSSAPAAPNNKRKGGSPVKRCSFAAPPAAAPVAAAAAAAAAGGAAATQAPAAGSAAPLAAGPSAAPPPLHPSPPAAAAAAATEAGAAARDGAAAASVRGARAEGAASVPIVPAAGQASREAGGEGSGGAPPPGNQV